MKTLDLKFGNPGFLQELNHNLFKLEYSSDDMAYLEYNVKPELENAIKRIHNIANNVGDGKYYLVVGNGASQILNALGQIRNVKYTKPAWSRFAALMPPNGKPEITLSTYPNNPDGSLDQSLEVDVVDACYNWQTYYGKSEQVAQLTNDVLIFSMSKLTGHASLRLGWALVRDAGLAKELADQIEIMSCGVSAVTQQAATKILSSIDESFFIMAQNKLRARWSELEEFWPSRHYGERRGMFLYIKDFGLFARLGALGISGEAFGDSPDMIRINIGCSKQDFNTLLGRLSEHRAYSVGV
jgi:histidinol-phosphate/aromatic aminotransferase/cobyric acid decarboxylase-like protein